MKNFKSLSKSASRALTALVFVAAVSTALFAAAPAKINYQGKLTDNSGIPINVATNVEFAVENLAGAQQWTSGVLSVTPVNGVFNQTLDVPETVFQGNTELYLELRVAGTPMAPRQRLVAAPYALAVAAGAVNTVEIVNNAVTGAKLSSSAGVDADRAVGTDHIKDGAVTSAKILDGTIATGDLANNAIDGNKLAADAVTSAKILDGTIATGDLANNAIDGNKLAADAVTSAKILDGTIATGDLANNAIDGNKLAADAVTSAKILDGTIATGDLANNAIDGNKLAADAVTSAKILDGTIATGDLANNAIDGNKLAGNAVTSAKIQDGTIVNADFSATPADALAASKVKGGTFASGTAFVFPDQVTMQGNLVVGSGGTALAKYLSAVRTYAVPNLTPDTSDTFTITVTGAVVGDGVVVTPPSGWGASLVLNAYVSAVNTVTVTVYNAGSNPVNPGSADYRAMVFHH